VVRLREDQQRKDDRRAQQRKDEPGRGAVDTSFREHPCPFQWTSQFGAPAREEALLGLATFWGNRRQPLLFPAQPPCQGVQKWKCAGQAVVSWEQGPQQDVDCRQRHGSCGPRAVGPWRGPPIGWRDS